ncbi:transmembrane protein 237A-like isoform X1 [Brienomyrus brachyistius]|uniref:transmembrane protein 237A-like isoform X1 n=1 Tax=Brienomyrus brachyistius TaxID=42636 RepID=UPI0020B296F2|nr:transmembrane protein 237A-like isoform X1 [Brienomyrus brachyistius]
MLYNTKCQTMENEKAQPTRTLQPVTNQHLPPLRPRALPLMPSLDMGDETPPPKAKKRKPKRESNEADDGDESAVEATAPEPQDIPPQKKKKKKKKKKIQTLDLEREGNRAQWDMANGGAAVEQHVDEEAEAPKAREKKKPKIGDRLHSSELDVEDEDVITNAAAAIPQHSLFSAPLGQSQPISKVFVERNRRFQATARTDLDKPSIETDDYLEITSVWSTRDVALKVHSGFRVVGLFTQGFLAGYAVWNTIVVYILAGEQLSSLANLLQRYHTLAYPAQSLLYLLLALSSVSAFDRVNLAKVSVAMKSFLTLEPAALASILYFAALILSLSQQMTSDRINLYNSGNGTLWPTGSEQRFLQNWIVVNLVVAVLVGLAWAFLCTRPELDYTEEFLRTMDVDEVPHKKGNPEIPA